MEVHLLEAPMKLVVVFLSAVFFSATLAQAGCPNLDGTFTRLVDGKKSTMILHSIPGDCSRIYMASSEGDKPPTGRWFDVSSETIASESSDRTYYSQYTFEGDAFVIRNSVQMKKVDFCIEPETKRRMVKWCPAEIIERSEITIRLDNGKLSFNISSNNKDGSTDKTIVLDRVSQ